MYKKPTFTILFPSISEEVRVVLMQEIPNLCERKIEMEVELITRVLVQQNIVILDDYKSNQNKVIVGLFVYCFHMNWKYLYPEFGRRKSIMQFLQQVINDYDNMSTNPNLAPEIRRRRVGSTPSLKLPRDVQKPKIA